MISSRFTRTVAVGIVRLTAAVAAAPGAAQTIRGTITGTITDSAGAVLAGGTAPGSDTAPSIATNVVTDARGNYTIPLLMPGTYQLVIEQPGSKKTVRQGVVV